MILSYIGIKNNKQIGLYGHMNNIITTVVIVYCI